MTDVYGSQENIVSEPTRDDLTKIKGIGATTAEKLYNVKIITVRQIAEMTPEKLSETPGIGLASAMKFIAAAKIYLSGSQTGGIANNSPQVVTSVTDESSSELIKNYEIVEVVVDEIQEISKEAPTEISEAFEQSQLNLKWFPDKFNYSRLTASYPPISKLGKNIDERVKEEENFVIEWDKDNNLNAPTEYEKEPTREIIREINSGHDQPELKNIIEDERVDYTPGEPKIIDFGDSRENILESSTNQQISTIFKDVGCYEIPCSLESLNQFTTNLDYLGCKLVIASDDLKFLFLFPVKWVDEEGTVLVDETKLELKSHAKRDDLGSYNNLKQISQNLLQTRDSMYEDLANNQNIREFFQKYLQITLSFERGFGNKSLLFLSGSTQYKVVIEPILLCNNSPRSMEKRLAFPYQRSSNLHAVTKLDLVPLIKFLEKKYRMIEKRTKKTNLVKDYRQSEEKLHTRVRATSFPIFGYSVALFIIYFAEWYFLLRLLNTIGLAVVGIYISLLTLFYFNFYRNKKQFAVQFETPYYLQNLEFSQIDLLDFKEDLTDELLTQFGYECLGKNVRFGVIEQSETNTLKHNLDIKRSKPDFQKMFEPGQIKTETVSNSTTKYGSKYSSFLDDP